MVGKIPLAVVAGIIIAVAVKMIDAQTIAFLMSPKKLLKSGKEQKIDLAVNLMVALLTVTVNLLVAVGAGLALASALFIARSGRSIIHRKYTLSQFRSRRMRPTTHQEILDKAGQETVILELKGPLFFGASDLLARQDDDRRLYFLVQGLVSVRLKTKDGLGVNRLASFSPGVIFGELSMLDGSLRSAEVVAEKDSQVLELPFHIFKELQQNHPELTAKLTTGIALWLSNRLKILSREIQVLERD
jgi:CRP-like cAMP-binding protein